MLCQYYKIKIKTIEQVCLIYRVEKTIRHSLSELTTLCQIKIHQRQKH